MITLNILTMCVFTEEKHRKIQTALHQQTLLIRTSCYVLLHLSEDPNVEEKMTKKEIIALLVKILQRKYNHNSVHGTVSI